jgi:transcriptional regulator with XRE-family HTH domain
MLVDDIAEQATVLDQLRPALAARPREQLANAAGVEVSTVYRLLAGTQEPTLAVVEALAAAAGLRLDLVPAEQPSSPPDDTAELLEALTAADGALVAATIARAPAGEVDVQARLARLLDRDRAAITRLLAGGSFGRGAAATAARTTLLRHLAGQIPLPERTPGGRRRKPGGRAERESRRKST